MTSVNSGLAAADPIAIASGLPISRQVPESPPLEGVTGRVKWFNDQKGFGFICDDEGRDVFVHYAVIDGDGFKTLEEGEVVRYEFMDGPKGRRATKVVRGA